MKKTIEKYFCDACGKEAEVKKISYPVIFHTEQTEGRGCEPYISQESLELCSKCLEKSLMIHGWGAQGFNRYEVNV